MLGVELPRSWSIPALSLEQYQLLLSAAGAVTSVQSLNEIVSGYEFWDPGIMQDVDSAKGMLDNLLQAVQTLACRQLGKLRKSTKRQVMLKELCWAPLSAYWCLMIARLLAPVSQGFNWAAQTYLP